jgi:hypothetical protein
MKTLGLIKEHEVKDGRTRFTAVANSGRSDRDGETIRVDGWEWQEGGVPLLYGHRTDDPNMIMGRVESIEKTTDGLMTTASINDDAGPMQRMVATLVRSGDLKSVSVGFDPFKWHDPGGKDDGRERGDPYPMPARGREYTRQELLELSFAPVQSDMGGLITGLKMMAAADSGPLANQNGADGSEGSPSRGLKTDGGTYYTTMATGYGQETFVLEWNVAPDDEGLKEESVKGLLQFHEWLDKYAWKLRLGLVDADALTDSLAAESKEAFQEIAAAAAGFSSPSPGQADGDS